MTRKLVFEDAAAKRIVRVFDGSKVLGVFVQYANGWDFYSKPDAADEAILKAWTDWKETENE